MHSNKSPTLKPQHLLIYKIKTQLSIFLKEFELSKQLSNALFYHKNLIVAKWLKMSQERKLANFNSSDFYTPI